MINKVCALAASLLLLCTACASPDPGAVPDAPSRVQETAQGGTAADPDPGRWEASAPQGQVLGGLTPQQMEEDFDYLWQALQDNYPFLGVALRSGVDGEAVYRRMRGELDGVADDLAFRDHIQRFIREYRGIAHFQSIPDSAWYEIYRDGYSAFRDNPEIPQADYLYGILTNPVTVRAYEGLAELEPAPAQQQEPREDAGDGGNPAVPQEPPANLTTEILEPGHIAYVGIRGFENSREEHDALTSFYRQAADCSHLIIDLTGNGGGEDLYWVENIVAPNIAGTLAYDDIILMPDTPLLREYLAAASPGTQLLPLEDLPPLPGLVEENLAELGGYYVDRVTVEPAESAPLFTGKVWVLVDGAVYSSSESFARFCRATGFATLVGTSTGGDGGGFDPLILALPNSGLLCRFSVQYTTNADGSNSEEFGTVPDILSPAGETPLETCLREIRSGG